MIKIVALITAIVVLLSWSPARAYETSRRGFVFGLGLGYGTTTQTGWEDSEAGGGPALGLTLGVGFSERFLIRYSVRAVGFHDNWREHSVRGGAMTYYLQSQAPSTYITGEVGRAHCVGGGKALAGFGIGAGLGYEFAKHLAVEVDYLHTSFGENLGVDRRISSIAVLLSWLAY